MVFYKSWGGLGVALGFFTGASAAADTATTAVSAAELELLRAATESAAPPAAPAPGSVGLPTSFGPIGPVSSLDLSLILDAALAFATAELELERGGHDPAPRGLTLQQLEMHADANVDPYFRMETNIVFSQFGVEVEEAYATTLALPAGLQARAGQFLTRIGRANPTHPHAWAFAEQPITHARFFGSEGSRGLGAELSWLTPLPWYLELVASATQPDGQCCAKSFVSGEPWSIRGPADFLYTLALKQFFPFDDDWSLALGLSAQLGPNATGLDNRTDLYAADLYLRYRPVDSEERRSLALTAEGFWRRRQVPFDLAEDGGFYVQLEAQIFLNWALAARYERLFGSAATEAAESRPDRQRALAALTFRPSHFSRLRLEAGADVLDESAVWAAFQLEVLIGAHGAHDY